MSWAIALLVATAAHAGFQSTVSLVVYPLFGQVPASAWPALHARHSRGIAPLVALLYAALLAACGGALVAGPRGPALGVAVGGVALALATTALVAAPLHSRLTPGPDPRLLSRLRLADAVRTLGALLALVGSTAHLATV